MGRMGDNRAMTMISSQPETAPVAALDLRSLAKTMRDRFSDGQRMRIRGSHVVHAVDQERWLHGEMIPQPLCHTPAYGWSPDALHAVRSPITCMRCQRKLASPDEILLPYGEFQPPLFTVAIPRQRTPGAA